MKATTIILISCFILLGANDICLAGKTSFSGSASCFMPYQLEFEEEKPQSTSDELQTPAVTGANGEYEVQKEIIAPDKTEKNFSNDDNMFLTEQATCPSCSINNESHINSETIVYTIYAR
ncbi:MAG: hypothetical protein ABIC68_03930 [Candidatus Omnitrophota bacterium]